MALERLASATTLDCMTDRGVQLTENFLSCQATATFASPRTASSDGSRGGTVVRAPPPIPVQSIGFSRGHSDGDPVLMKPPASPHAQARRQSEIYQREQSDESHPVVVPLALLQVGKLSIESGKAPSPPQLHSQGSSQPSNRTRRFSINKGEQIVVIPPHWRCPGCSDLPPQETPPKQSGDSVFGGPPPKRNLMSSPSFEQSGFLASLELENDMSYQPHPWSPIKFHHEQLERQRGNKRFNIPTLDLRTPARVKPKSILKRDMVPTDRPATTRIESSLRFSVHSSVKEETATDGESEGCCHEAEDGGAQTARPWNESEGAVDRLRSLSQSCHSNHTKSPDSNYAQYFTRVPEIRSPASLISKQKGLCPHCNNGIHAPPSLPTRLIATVRESLGWTTQAEPSSTYTFVPSDGPRTSALCAFTGLLFCHQCISPKRMVIPSAVLSTWDFSTRTVAEPAAELLTRYISAPLLSIRQVHPAVKRIVPTIHKVHTLRRELLSLKDFFLLGRKYSESCTVSADSESSWHGNAEKSGPSRECSGQKVWESNDFLPCEDGTRRFCSSLMRELVPRLPGEYWIMSTDLYSLTDFIAINLYHGRLQDARRTFEFPNPFPRLEGLLRCREEPPTARSGRAMDSRTPSGGLVTVLRQTSSESDESDPPILQRAHNGTEDPLDAFLGDLQDFTVYWENHVVQECTQCRRGFDKFKLTGTHNLTVYTR